VRLALNRIVYKARGACHRLLELKAAGQLSKTDRIDAAQIKDRAALKGQKSLTSPLLKRQAEQRLGQITMQIKVVAECQKQSVLETRPQCFASKSSPASRSRRGQGPRSHRQHAPGKPLQAASLAGLAPVDRQSGNGGARALGRGSGRHSTYLPSSPSGSISPSRQNTKTLEQSADPSCESSSFSQTLSSGTAGSGLHPSLD
jgi:hypothetical protein